MTTFEQQLQNSLSHAYDIERELGGGGMSRVFVATEKSLGRKVVIKLLSPELTADVNRGRFRREIQVAAQLQHPHIVTLLSAGEDGDLVYYTMPFITGESLKSALEKNGPLSVGEVVRVLYDVVDALDYAHEQGVVHRDIKPANILRSGSHALVTDFGVAKALNAAMPSGAMTSTGMAIGTPAYMSPEQLAGDPAADHRIDIYAVGLLAYELLTGASPFAAKSPRGVLAAVLTREPPSLVEVHPGVPRSLSEMVMSCLSKEPEARPPSARALMATLDMFSTSSGEIRTREYKVPKASTGPVTSPVAPAGDPALSGSVAVPAGVPSGAFSQHVISVGGNTAPDRAPIYAASRSPKSQKRMLMGWVALLLPVAAGAIFLSQRTGESASTESVLPVDTAIADSASQRQPLAAIPESRVAAALVDSLAIADSARARAARAVRAEAAKRAAAAKADSLRLQAEQRSVGAARRAVAALLADPDARRSFMRGASRTGGILGTQRKGDLQTQIDALQPFLTNDGLTYDQFKRIVAEAGFRIFDEFGRMVPEALQRFAAAVRDNST